METHRLALSLAPGQPPPLLPLLSLQALPRLVNDLSWDLPSVRPLFLPVQIIWQHKYCHRVILCKPLSTKCALFIYLLSFQTGGDGERVLEALRAGHEPFSCL